MDEAELRQELEQCHAASYGWALQCCRRDPVEAEDVLQTVYLKVLSGRARFAGRSAFRTWLFAVVRQTAADERRRHWLRRWRLGQYAAEQETTAPAAGEVADNDRLAAFGGLLAALPRRQQEVLHLVFYQDLTIQEAAAVMHVSLGSARQHYERGKARLREWLSQREANDEPGTQRVTA
jgi:RNA polymerase sigma-70 factor (ECF subfamily)